MTSAKIDDERNVFPRFVLGESHLCPSLVAEESILWQLFILSEACALSKGEDSRPEDSLPALGYVKITTKIKMSPALE